MFSAELFKKQLFTASPLQFNELAMALFRHQAVHCEVYARYLQLLGKTPQTIQTLHDIPFLPVELFKTHPVICPAGIPVVQRFLSSGTTEQTVSTHLIHDLSLYEQSFTRSFELFYGNVQQYCILGLLPSYLERGGSSLVYMTQKLIELSKHPQSGFYLHNYPLLAATLKQLAAQNQPVILLGVTYALLNLAEQYPQPLKGVIVMETGGMKGRRREMVRSELHHLLCSAFQLTNVHSEYGMTELLSQAYSTGGGIFRCPPWMRVLPREVNDPLSTGAMGETAGLNIIDLANLYSCAFIATQDLGRVYADGSFEPLGRFDNSDVRGCNLLLA